MGIFDGLRAVVAAKHSTASTIEAALTDAERLQANLQAQLEAHRAAADTSRRELLMASPEERERSRLALAKLEVEAADAGLYVEELQARLAAQQGVEAEERRRAAYDAAREKINVAARALKKEYPEIGKKLVALLRLVGEADEATSAVNEDLPVGAVPLWGPEAQVRDAPAMPKHAVSAQEVDLWVDVETGQPLMQAYQDELNQRPGQTYRRPGWHFDIKVEKRRFNRVEFHPPTRREAGPRLADVVFPGLRFGDPPYWAVENRIWGVPILGRLAALAAAAAAQITGPTEIEFVPLGENRAGPAPADLMPAAREADSGHRDDPTDIRTPKPELEILGATVEEEGIAQ